MIRTLAAVVATVALSTTALAGKGTASDFTLRTIDNESFTLSEHKGEVLLLSFWATWCGPCKEEMPHLDKLYKKHKDAGFTVVSISSDDARTASRVKPFIRSKGFSFPVVLDKDSTVTGVYNPAKTLPYTVVIGRDFQVRLDHSGYNPGDEEEIAKLVEELLAEGQAAGQAAEAENGASE